jgi:hypothetical protein
MHTGTTIAVVIVALIIIAAGRPPSHSATEPLGRRTLRGCLASYPNAICGRPGRRGGSRG